MKVFKLCLLIQSKPLFFTVKITVKNICHTVQNQYYFSPLLNYGHTVFILFSYCFHTIFIHLSIHSLSTAYPQSGPAAPTMRLFLLYSIYSILALYL